MDQLKLLFAHWPVNVRPKESAYFYLFAFLQLVEGYGPGYRAWQLFGNAQHMSFAEWWVDREDKVFVHGSSLGIWELEDDKAVAEARSQGLTVVSIDMSCSRAYLNGLFHDLLSAHDVEQGRGQKRRNRDIVEPAWFFEAKPDIHALRLYFCVYVLSTRKGLSHAQIAKRLRINTTATQNKKTNVIEATVSRYLKKAKRIIAGLEYGKFPVFYEMDEKGQRI